MRDTVRYALPFARSGVAHRAARAPDLEAIFDYRARAVRLWTVSVPSMPSARWLPTGQ